MEGERDRLTYRVSPILNKVCPSPRGPYQTPVGLTQFLVLLCQGSIHPYILPLI